MSQPEAAPLLTAEEFAALPDNGMKQELIAGEVVEMPPASFGHGEVCHAIMRELGLWVKQHHLGRCSTNDPGIVIARGPDTVRAPDGAFYRAGRLPEPLVIPYPDIPPDLVVEVVSEHDRHGDVLAKAGQWLSTGVQVVWVAWPSTTRITVYGPGDEIRLLGREDVLTCESLLPGFALPVRDVFPG
ncbi:MAG: Uma2 family endonuclease [Armatimonadetes bacterium]|nr:Uma2 family endonuclease [Armatimonadota bacterium]